MSLTRSRSGVRSPPLILLIFCCAALHTKTHPQAQHLLYLDPRELARAATCCARNSTYFVGAHLNCRQTVLITLVRTLYSIELLTRYSSHTNTTRSCCLCARVRFCAYIRMNEQRQSLTLARSITLFWLHTQTHRHTDTQTERETERDRHRRTGTFHPCCWRCGTWPSRPDDSWRKTQRLFFRRPTVFVGKRPTLQ